MDKNDKIYIAGHTGMIGSAMRRRLRDMGFNNILCREHARLDLTDQQQVKAFFEKEKPDYVFYAAGKVGGVFANNTYRAEFIYENMMMQNNIIHNSFLAEVKKLIYCGSADVYPKECPQPAKEEYLLSGSLESTCEPFALAKITGLKMCESYNRQYGTDFIGVVLPNIYGPNQHYDIMNSQVLPALIKKLHEAKIANTSEISIWGTGSPVRDFLFVDDVIDASIFLFNKYPSSYIFNIGTEYGCSIRELVSIIKDEVGYKGKIHFDTKKPDGVAKKLLDITRIISLGWKCRMGLNEGIKITYKSFLKEMEHNEIRTSRILRISTSEKDTALAKNVELTRSITEQDQPDDYVNRVVMKPWGYEFLVFDNECIAIWFLFIKNGQSTSMHCHRNKKTSLILLSGNAMNNTFAKRRYLMAGDAVIIEKGVFHSTKALSDNGISLLEIEAPPNKTDLMRLEDHYGREVSGYEGISEMQTYNLQEYNHFHFKESDFYERNKHSTKEYDISFEVFSNSADFKKHFKTRGNELLTSCRGTMLSEDGKVLLGVGDTQKSDTLPETGKIKISGKLILLRSRSK